MNVELTDDEVECIMGWIKGNNHNLARDLKAKLMPKWRAKACTGEQTWEGEWHDEKWKAIVDAWRRGLCFVEHNAENNYRAISEGELTAALRQAAERFVE